MITFQIVTYNSEKSIEKCLKSIFNIGLKNFEIIILDNNSNDHTIEIIQKLKEKIKNISLIKSPSNLGFAKAHNQMANLAQGNSLFILNPDTIFISQKENGYLEKISFNLQNKIYGFLFLNEDKTIQATIGFFPNILRVIFDRLPLIKKFFGMIARNKNIYKKERSVDWLCGCGLFVSKENFLSIRGFDEDYFLYCEDIDICKKLKEKNILRIFDPDLSFIHLKESRDLDKRPKKYFWMRKGLMLYFKKHNSKTEQLLLFITIRFEALIKILCIQNKNWQNNIKKVLSLKRID